MNITLEFADFDLIVRALNAYAHSNAFDGNYRTTDKCHEMSSKLIDGWHEFADENGL